MKIFLFFLMGAIGCCFFFSGCAKEDLGNLDSFFSDTAAAGPISKMTAKVNDTDFVAVSTDVTIKPGQIVLTGYDSKGERIGFTINSSNQGDYLLKFGATNVARYYPDSLTTNPYSSNASSTTGGVVNISEIDSVNGYISGQFNFIGARTNSKLLKTVTEGTFTNISYITSTTTPFTVKKNGKPWKPANVTATVSGNTISIVASTAKKDTVMTLKMPSNIGPSTKPYVLTALGPKNLYTADVTELIQGKNFDLQSDTSATIKKKYKISPALTILSNSGNIINGTFSFVASYAIGKVNVITTFNTGSFYLKY